MKTKDEIMTEIQTLIEENIKPAVASHGGMIELKDFDEESGRVLVLLQGGCSGCASSSITLKMGVENMLTHYIPEITEAIQQLAAFDPTTLPPLQKIT